jgi:acyl-CoA synthetase (AMP-forming)/AMP-acid ligase II
MNANLAEHLLRVARERPDQPALVDCCGGRERSWSFARLAADTARAAAALRAAGLRAGDVLLLWQPMSAELYILLIGAWRAGLVALFMDPGQHRRHKAAGALLWPPRALAGPWQAHLLSWTVPGLRGQLRRFITAGWFPGARRLALDAAEPADTLLAECDDDTPALVTCTSGSTGEPKAIVRTHGFLRRQHEVLVRELELQPGQIDLTGMPIFVLANLGSAVTSLIPAGNIARPGAIEPAPVLAQVRRWHPDRAIAAPAFWERLLQGGAVPELAALRKIFTGGGPVHGELMQRLRHAAPQAQVTAVYGSTEAEPMAHITAAEWSALPAQAGRWLPAGAIVEGMDVRVLADHWGQPLPSWTPQEFAAQQLPPGQVGEIVVAGALVIPGYLHGRGDAETKIRVGNIIWHRTGDAGCIDAAGRLWLAGRCAAKVRLGERVLYPLEVELCARQVRDVRRCALVQCGDHVILAVEADAAETSAAVRQHLVAHQFTGVQVRRVPHLPMDRRHNSKIDLVALRARLHKTAT